jgi:hypothetical protein
MGIDNIDESTSQSEVGLDEMEEESVDDNPHSDELL